MPYSVLFCRFPGNAHEYYRCTGWIAKTVLKMSKDPRVSHVEPYVVIDTPITMTRNRAVRYAIDKKYDYILMVDSDMHPDLYVENGAPAFWDVAWDFMMKRREEEPKWEADLEEIKAKEGDVYPSREEAIRLCEKGMAPATIAAPYCGPPPHENVFVFEWKGFNTGDPPPYPFKLDQLTREQVVDRTGIQEVPALPTGVILYDTRTFLRLPKPWFCYEYKDEYETEKVTTEDVFQTRNAAMMGMPQFVTWDCWAGHVKLKVVGKPISLSCDVVQKQLANAIKCGQPIDKRVAFTPLFHSALEGVDNKADQEPEGPKEFRPEDTLEATIAIQSGNQPEC